MKDGELHNGATYGPGAAGPFKHSKKDRPLEPHLAKVWNQNILVQSQWAVIQVIIHRSPFLSSYELQKHF